MEISDRRREGLSEKIKKNSFVRRVLKIKNIKWIAAVFIIAVALIIYSTVIDGSGKKQTVVDSGGASSGETMDEEELKLAKILSGISGAGRVETMITRKGDEIVGVLIIAEGAADISVRFRLLDAATTALNVDKKIVDVFVKK